jgi:RNA polymerase sigma factor (sigma-70 family)
MEPWPKTQPSLLVRIRDANDHLAWHRFVEVYAPPLYQYGRRQGLQDADASDLTQEIFRRVVRAMGSLDYNRQQGTFRGWLFTLTRNCYRNYLASATHRAKTDGKAIGGSGYHQLLDQIPDSNTADTLADNSRLWDEQYEHHLLEVASANIRENFAPNTWQAFWQTAVVGKSPQEVACELEMSVGSVYVAKSRIVTRLKQEIEQLENH